VVLVRLSEVTDWDEGGRTSSQAATRIFSKEAVEGPRQVLVARREVRVGSAWR
jgi:cancer susceptibility candidate protein 1